MKLKMRNHWRIVPLKLAKKLATSLIFILLFEFSLVPAPVSANGNSNDGFFGLASAEEEVNNLPVNEDKDLKVTRSSYHPMTAYNSEPGQTDDSPCITANGFDVCKHGKEDTIAANFLKFGTKVRIPELFGDRVFVVRDRMNSRYTDRIDVWMVNRSDALKFGKRVAKIEIVE